MFENLPTQLPRNEPEDNAIDRGTEPTFLAGKVNFRKAEADAERLKSANGVPKESKQARDGTLTSALLASVPQEPRRIRQGLDIGTIKYDDEDVKHQLSERPKRSTRTTARRARTPTPEPERFSKTHGLGEKWDQPIVYPDRDPKTEQRSKKQVSIEFEDLERLDEGEWLNDTLIEYCLLYIQENFKQHASKVYFFSNFFYTKLTSTARGKSIDYEAVQRWTAKDDIFTYDFVVVPVCEKGHWYLALICNLPNVQRKLDPEEEVIKVDTLEHDEQIEQAPITTAREDTTSTLELKNTQQANSSTTLPSPTRGPTHTSFDIEDTLGPVQKHADQVDIQNVSQKNVDTLSLEAVSNGQPKATTPSIRKKGKRGPTPITYPPGTPVIAILDSMPSSSKHYATIKALKSYLVEEALSKRGMDISPDDFKGMQPTAGFPLQDNFSDCGLYLCRYVEVLMKDPKDFGEKLLAAAFDMERDWGDWDSSSSRAEIRNQLQALQSEQADNRRSKAERKAAKRAAAQPKVEHKGDPPATEGSAAIADGPPGFVSSSPVKASKHAKATSPVKDLSPARAASRVSSPPKSARPLPNSVRVSSPIFRETTTLRSPARAERGGSVGPRFSARSTPTDHDAYSGQDHPIQIYEDTTPGPAPDKEPRDLMREDNESMLHEEEEARYEEEPEWGGIDDDGQDAVAQLIEAAEGRELTDTPEGSPQPGLQRLTGASHASQQSSQQLLLAKDPWDF